VESWSPGWRVRALADRLLSAPGREADGSLLAAIARALESSSQRARENLKMAEHAGAAAAEAELVRASVAVRDAIWSRGDPSTLAPLRDLSLDLDRAAAVDPFDCRRLALHALVCALVGDPAGAERQADLLLRAAPTAAETFAVRWLLHVWSGDLERADEDLEAALRADPGLDRTRLRLWHRLVAVSRDEWGRAIHPGEMEELRAQAAALFQGGEGEAVDPGPLARFLSGALAFVDADLETAVAEFDALSAFVWFSGVVSASDRLIEIGRNAAEQRRLPLLLEARAFAVASLRHEAAARFVAEIEERLAEPALRAADGVDDGRAAEIRRENAYLLALVSSLQKDEGVLLERVRTLLDLGYDKEALRADPGFSAYTQRPAFQELLAQRGEE
jgi:hypothetical protein